MNIYSFVESDRGNKPRIDGNSCKCQSCKFWRLRTSEDKKDPWNKDGVCENPKAQTINGKWTGKKSGPRGSRDRGCSQYIDYIDGLSLFEVETNQIWNPEKKKYEKRK